MLPENPMRSERETPAKIIPMRRPRANKTAARLDDNFTDKYTDKYTPASTRAQLVARIATTRRRERGTNDDARHYLKFMLPGIPVTTFVLTFLYGYLLQGMHTLVLNGHATEQSYTPAVDPTLPLIGALLVAFATGMLCLAIYWGYQRISERATEHKPS